jgi:hypothetical protein
MTKATEMQTKLSFLTKFVVPSIGSIIHVGFEVKIMGCFVAD